MAGKDDKKPLRSFKDLAKARGAEPQQPTAESKPGWTRRHGS